MIDFNKLSKQQCVELLEFVHESLYDCIHEAKGKAANCESEAERYSFKYGFVRKSIGDVLKELDKALETIDAPDVDETERQEKIEAQNLKFAIKGGEAARITTIEDFRNNCK